MQGLLIKDSLIPDNYSSWVKRDVLIEHGRIKQIAKEITCAEQDVKLLQLNEQYLMPGIIDCHTHLGIIEEATGKIGVDNNETSDAVTPHLRGIDAINPLDIAFKDAIRCGITCVMSGPGSDNAVGGLNAAIKTYGRVIDEMVVRNPVGLKVALGENPISTYGKDSRCPVTRMGTASLIRELLMRTQDYMVEKEQGNISRRDIRLEAVIPVLRGEIALRAHAHRADDIMTAIRIAEEFDIKKLVIEHGTEADLVKEYLRQKNIPVAFGPMLTPRIKMELKGRNYRSVVSLVEAGVKVALITDHPYNPIDQLRTIAVLAIVEGLKPFDAFKCLTVHPAEILECDNRIGKLAEGFDADLVVFDGYPGEISSKVILTCVNGQVVFNSEKDFVH